MQSSITIIDYGMGNLRSVQKKFIHVGAKPIITSNPEEISKADKIVLPGIGHFSSGVNKLKKSGIWHVLNEKVLNQRTPILGICLGMQLMAGNSEEGNKVGLNWFDAQVVKFKVSDHLKYKIPHIGWNSAIENKNSLLLKDINPKANFYFVHSYHILCNRKEDILTTTQYEYFFTSAIQKDNIFGVQFHPEKSHDWGERVFKNFANL